MNDFFPFIHKVEKKNQEEMQQIYIELIPIEKQEETKDDESKIIIIEL
jgi:hypothetical protein